MSNKAPEKRLKVYEISADVITEILKFAIENSVPGDSRVNTVFYDPRKNCFGVIVHSKEFQVVAEGATIPTEQKVPVLSTDIFMKVTDNLLRAKEAEAQAKKDLKIMV